MVAILDSKMLQIPSQNFIDSKTISWITPTQGQGTPWYSRPGGHSPGSTLGEPMAGALSNF